MRRAGWWGVNSAILSPSRGNIGIGFAVPVNLASSIMNSLDARIGRFDGIYGVIAGLEALTALHEANATLRRPVEVVAWTNEEGGRFAPGCMGSMAWSGFRRIEDFADVVDPDNIRFADALPST